MTEIGTEPDERSFLLPTSKNLKLRIVERLPPCERPGLPTLKLQDFEFFLAATYTGCQ